MDHIIVCGHYDCALIDKGDGSELGGWHKYVLLWEYTPLIPIFYVAADTDIGLGMSPSSTI